MSQYFYVKKLLYLHPSRYFVKLFNVNLFLFFFLALPHTSSYSLMMGGFGGANIQKAQSLIDLGSSRYEYLKLPTF